MDNEQIITNIRNYIYLLNTEGFGISRAFLYDSYASGNSNKSRFNNDEYSPLLEIVRQIGLEIHF